MPLNYRIIFAYLNLLFDVKVCTHNLLLSFYSFIKTTVFLLYKMFA